MKKIINTEKAPKPIGPYNQAVMVDNTLYVSGQIPMDPAKAELVKGDIKDQTRQVMENLKAILLEAGMDFNNVVKFSIFISDMKNFPQINEVYGIYLSVDFPARETVQVSVLHFAVDVEISCVEVK